MAQDMEQSAPKGLIRHLSRNIVDLAGASTNKIFGHDHATPPMIKSASVVPFGEQRRMSVDTRSRGSIGYEPMRRISNARKTSQMTTTHHGADTVFALRAVAKLNKNLNKSHHTKRSLQKLDTDRHAKVLEQYTIRVHNKHAEEDVVVITQTFPLFLINPTVRWYKIWQLCTLGLIIYQSFQIPYALGFGSSVTNPFRDYEGISINCIFGFDFLLNCNTALPDLIHVNRYITSRRTILWQYAKGWMFLDLIAFFPIDIAVYVIALGSTANSAGGQGSSFTFLSLLKAVRLPRLLRLARLVRVLKILQIPPEWKRWLLYSRYSHLIRLVSTIVFFYFTIHIAACLWIGSVASANWTDMFQTIPPDAVSDYALSIFFCLTTFLGQPGNLHNQTEVVFSTTLVFIGSLLMAAVFGDVAVLLANFHEKQNDYKKKMESLFSCMETMRLPLDLQNRINEFYQTMWEVHETLDGQPATLTSELSRNLATEVELFLRLDMINRVPIFHACSKRVIQEIVMKLTMAVFLPGDYVVVRGELASEMYFVQTGVCEVTQGGRDASLASVDKSAAAAAKPEDEILIRLLKQGDFFGEIALLMQCKRTANVRAKIFAELCVLTRDVFESITERYVEDRERMEKHITEKYDPTVLQQIADQKRFQSVVDMPGTTTSPKSSLLSAATSKEFMQPHMSSSGESGLADRVRGLEESLARIEAKQDAILTSLLKRDGLHHHSHHQAPSQHQYHHQQHYMSPQFSMLSAATHEEDDLVSEVIDGSRGDTFKETGGETEPMLGI
ncbi:Aste57867_16421 [Aphanomyces stellatus]|uniref:Aste57867_16421 protein n=1 Tax=Aphanomyces stellatus TaxID=120398 RepID=A0A485L6N2_9STRA|nr:hypothetical protein As57867_016364 [Aphanomyces stellatus]VFT93196.1 Aste57867_16421 [Aphanomyces stellatus]